MSQVVMSLTPIYDHEGEPVSSLRTNITGPTPLEERRPRILEFQTRVVSHSCKGPGSTTLGHCSLLESQLQMAFASVHSFVGKNPN